MDPFYFTTDLDYAFGANSGFNPEKDMQVQAARKSAAAKHTKPQKSSSKKSVQKRLNYDGMSFNQAFASALKAGRSVFDWRGKRYTTQLAPENIEVPMPTIEPEPMDRAYNPADTALRSYTPAAAMASYQADAGLRRAAMQPATVNLNGVQVPQYGWGGWLLPIGSCE